MPESKRLRRKVAMQDLTPKQDPKGGGVIVEDRPNPTTLNLNNSTTTLTINTNTTVKP